MILGALVQKNYLGHLRAPVSTILSIVFPVLMISILALVKMSTNDSLAPTYNAPFYPDKPDIPLGFADFVTTYGRNKTCQCSYSDCTPYEGNPDYDFIWYIDGHVPENPFVVCNPTLCQKAGEDATTTYCSPQQVSEKLCVVLVILIDSNYPMAMIMTVVTTTTFTTTTTAPPFITARSCSLLFFFSVAK